jgi:CheY-like chemotaxis protein/predicted regulator of Ras-like GTPase activity (Roadblock/LC7/MglB family)
MPRVLLVDDDLVLLQSFQKSVPLFAPELEVVTASSGHGAVEILEQEKIDVVITDLRMPGIDGIDLFGYVSRTRPDTAFLALTGVVSSEEEGELRSMGMSQVLAKPVRAEMLVRRIREALEGARGYVQGFSLPTLTQLIGIERKTCTLEVHNNGNTGLLFFQEGDLIDAQSDGMEGTEAAAAILCWPAGETQIHRQCARSERRIHEAPQGILLRCLIARDEQQQRMAELLARAVDDLVESPTGGAGEGEGQMIRLETVLSEFREQVPEFVATDLVNLESGLSIGGSSADAAFDASAASASFGEVVRANLRALELMGMDGSSAEDILITTARVNILLRMLGRNYYHCLAIGKKGSLGFARAVMKKYETALLSALGEVDSQA